jgi:hypothetical protein
MQKKYSTLLLIIASFLGVFLFAYVTYSQIFTNYNSSDLAVKTKIFIRSAEETEAVVNDWLSRQNNIIIESINSSDYGSEYAVAINYRFSADRNVFTRIKIFDNNTLINNNNVDENAAHQPTEVSIQKLIDNFSKKNNIISTDLLVGSGPWNIFVVYEPINSEAEVEEQLGEVIMNQDADESADLANNLNLLIEDGGGDGSSQSGEDVVVSDNENYENINEIIIDKLKESELFNIYSSEEIE